MSIYLEVVWPLKHSQHAVTPAKKKKIIVTNKNILCTVPGLLVGHWVIFYSGKDLAIKMLMCVQQMHTHLKKLG